VRKNRVKRTKLAWFLLLEIPGAKLVTTSLKNKIIIIILVRRLPLNKLENV
jgi:hypothetical protein